MGRMDTRRPARTATFEEKMNFYKLKEAAAAIAAELHPAGAADNSNDLRADAERCYLTALRDAVCENEIVYRDPGSRLPIRQELIAAFMTSHWCVVSVADLNAWLLTKGVGIQVPSGANASDIVEESAGLSQADDVAESEWPTSTQLAAALGPFLARSDGADWLKGRLSDAERYAALKKYRRLEGKGAVARWEVSGVTVYLIDLKLLNWDSAAEALEAHYPRSAHVLAGLGNRKKEISATTWFPPIVDE